VSPQDNGGIAVSASDSLCRCGHFDEKYSNNLHDVKDPSPLLGNMKSLDCGETDIEDIDSELCFSDRSKPSRA